MEMAVNENDEQSLLDETGKGDDLFPNEATTSDADQTATEQAAPAPVEAKPTGEKPLTGAEAAPPPGADAQKRHEVPLTVILDEREKRKEAERRAAEMEAKLAEIEAKRQEQPAPDWFENPDAAFEYRLKRQQVEAHNARLAQSRFLAEREFGADVVKEAYDYFAKNPHLTQPFAKHPSPFHAAVETYQKQKLLIEAGDNPQAYIDQLVEQRLQERLQAGQQSSNPAPSAPPPSIAKAPATGGQKQPVGDAFDQAFPI